MYPSVTERSSMMTPRQHPPVILFLGERSHGDDPIDKWLAESRYSVLEAADVFQALDHISDFTQAERPDVVFLHVDSGAQDIEFMQALVTTAADGSDIPMIDFADRLKTREVEEFTEAIAGLACRLDEFIPMHSTAKA